MDNLRREFLNNNTLITGFYCDICLDKILKGASKEGAIKSILCHFAIQHDELRPLIEKDDRFSEDFKKDVYYVRFFYSFHS